jgi:Ser/Thr protein kinase RdoA (MazF antagonist)
VDKGYDTQKIGHFLSAYHTAAPLSGEEEALFGEVLHYIAFRHAVFMLKMVAQARVSSFAGNEDIPPYLHVRAHGAPKWNGRYECGTSDY